MEYILDAVQPLQAHDQFIAGLLAGLRDIVPSDMLSYNEFADVDRDTISGWNPTELMQSAIVIWTPATETGGLSVSDQGTLAMKHLDEHPVMLRSTRRLYRSSDLIAQPEWHQSTLYNELHRPLRIEAQCHVHLPGLPGRIITLTYSREHGDFSDRELRALKPVQNLLRHSFRDHWRYLEITQERARWRCMSDSSDHGFLHITRGGAVGWANRRAQKYLADYGLSPTSGELPDALADWLRPVLTGRALTVPVFHHSGSAQGRSQTHVKVLSITHEPDNSSPTGAMLSLSVQAIPAEPADTPMRRQSRWRVLSNQFGLTPRESEVAWWISRGKSNPDIAAILHRPV